MSRASRRLMYSRRVRCWADRRPPPVLAATESWSPMSPSPGVVSELWGHRSSKSTTPRTALCDATFDLVVAGIRRSGLGEIARVLEPGHLISRSRWVPAPIVSYRFHDGPPSGRPDPQARSGRWPAPRGRPSTCSICAGVHCASSSSTWAPSCVSCASAVTVPGFRRRCVIEPPRRS